MRSCTLLSDGWKFCASAENFSTPLHKQAHYKGAKTENRLRGFASLSYSTDEGKCNELWSPVTVPHDYIVAQTPSPAFTGALGCQDYPEAWYRRNFRFTENDRGRRIVLCFEAVATRCEIYFNGCFICENHTAYTPFEADISDYVKFGETETNLLAVRICPTAEHEGWWYTGAGITRPVWLLKTDPAAIDHRGVWVRPVKVSDTLWRCEIETTLVNEKFSGETVTVQSEIDRKTAVTEAVLLPYEKTVVRQTIDVENPRLWDTEHPDLYCCRSSVLRNGTEIDQTETTFGFRTAEFRTDGFYLNGVKTFIKGVCIHEDYGITGRAVPPEILRYRVRLMREMGANGWRCAHYPHSDVTMDALDRAGMLTMAETRHFSAAPEHMDQLCTLVRRDRNHPSVILWSIGNEEWYFAEERGRRIGKRMLAAVRRLDPDRSVTCAVDKNVDQAPVHDVVDVMGVNYNMPKVDPLHENRSDKPMIYSECTASGTSDRWYSETDDGAGQMADYDRRTNSFGHSAAYTWKFITDRPFLSGGYQWAGMEYRGEAEWPRLCSVSGGVDLFLQKKDSFARMRTLWTDTPEVYLIPHWNLRGREGEEIPVQIYTNCARVTLTLNGRVLGEKKTNRYEAARFAVPYEPGTILAVGYDKNGTEIARHEVKTTGEAVGLKLRLDNESEMREGGIGAAAHITAVAVDADGNEVPDAADTLTFSITGAAESDFGTAGRRAVILGTGSSNCDPVPPKSRTRRMENGRAAVCVRTGEGVTRIVVHGDRLGWASLEL